MSAKQAHNDAGPIVLSDMSRCTPSSALAAEPKRDCWQLIPYETCGPNVVSGTMLGAASFIDAAPVTLPLGVTGWHSVYVAFWNPHHDYDGGTTVKVKLSDDASFIRIREDEQPLDPHAACLKEAFFKTADLTGQDLVLGKLFGRFARKVYIAYVRLVPLSAEEVAAVEADRAKSDTRILQATIDGVSYFWGGEHRRREHLLELVERYRHADVDKVIWAFNYGETTNYPSKVGTFGHAEHTVLTEIPPLVPYIFGEREVVDSMQSLASQGIVPQEAVAEYVHEMGLKFDAMFRIGIAGSIPPNRAGGGFMEAHPECRQMTADGTPIEKASFVYPAVRDLTLGIIREVAENFDIDGAQICFVRGAQFMQYEQPILDDFRAEYGCDGREVDFRDPRMQKVRCRYLTQLMRDTREVLDEVGEKKGKKIELAAWVSPSQPRYILDCAVDVLAWLEEGLLDSLVAYTDLEVHPDVLFDGSSLPLISAAKASGCRFIRAFNLRGHTAEHMVALAKAVLAGYDAGVDGFAVWDIDGPQDHYGGVHQWWDLARRIGHRQEMEAFLTQALITGTPPGGIEPIRLKTVGKYDVEKALFAVAYSGG